MTERDRDRERESKVHGDGSNFHAIIEFIVNNKFSVEPLSDCARARARSQTIWKIKLDYIQIVKLLFYIEQHDMATM